MAFESGVLDESGTDGAECSRKVASGKRVAGAIRFLVNAKNLHLECNRTLYETLIYVFLFMILRHCYGR